MRKCYRILFIVVLFLSLLPLHAYSVEASSFRPVPQEDRLNGRNSHAYLPSINRPTLKEQEVFIQDISKHAVNASEKWGVPASAIIGMAILESGYGTTRIAYHANNLFGVKVWGYNPQNAWQLVGQPDEDFERVIPVLSNLGNDRIIFDETKRRDNWYRKFASYEEAVIFVVGTLLLNSRYGFARERYHTRLSSGWTIQNASKQYLFDIGDAGYNHLGGDYYRRTIGTIMDQWNLYQYDGGFHLRDARGHWAESSILFVAEQKWMNGFNDGTFRPNETLTRAQAATVMVNYLAPKATGTTVTFHDVTQTHWARHSIILVAQHKIMNGTAPNQFSPNMIMTRSQMVQILFNAGLYSEPVKTTTSSFKDVSDNHWALVAIETMRSEGIVNGFNDGTFRPNEPITRAQMAVVLQNVYQKQNK
ncbi:Parasporal protein [Anaerobacillus alkaliphilus]|uniref:Parasporal protein n=1 Tax=Anaerobacillus alkaliphilus TaxID=1548597 RepID=A0A4Q0VYM9_9BACI|nr:S-layer homology domain-containing protein [Anaerobacillus alkaliphilus]RXJ04560.1 Parasporal protein [Anaerobacillus alkaliphilus]